MKYVTIPTNIRYTEAYLPTPRHRKLRYRDAFRTVNLRVRSVTSAEAPVAFRCHDYHHVSDRRDEVRLFAGKLYARMVRRTSVTEEEAGMGGYVPMKADELHISPWTRWADSFEKILSHYKEEARTKLFIDGETWEVTGEPMYTIMTFGLGHNHGGTALMVENFYNPNIPNRNYFRADQGAEAVAEMDRVAAARGDTESVGKYTAEIEVLIPEAVKRRPMKEHGGGDPFMNRLHAITAKAGSVAEAGLLTMVVAMNEVKG
jgi:hypothetical protein